MKFREIFIEIGAKNCEFEQKIQDLLEKMQKDPTKFCRNFEFGEVQKRADLVDLENPEKMRLLSLSEASIQKRTSLSKFDDLAATSELNTVPD